MKQVAVFASGTGSNFEALLKSSGNNQEYRIVLLVSDKPASLAVERAKRADVDIFAFSPKDYADKAEMEQAIVGECRSRDIDWIVLAGYMRLVGPTLLQAYPDRIINLHPALLPNFPGKDAIGQALAAGVEKTGVTVHYVDAGMDTGPVIRQTEIPILPTDSLETLAERVHQEEHRLLPEVLRELVSKSF